MAGDRSQLLQSVALFRDLADDGVAAVASKCQWSRIEKDSEILHESDPTTDIFFVLQGAVVARSYSLDGKEVSYSDIRQGEMFGEFSAIDHMPRSATIHALETSLIARMSSGDFRQVLVDYPQTSLFLSEHLVRKLRKLTNRVFEFSTMSVRYRIHAELLRLCGNSVGAGNSVTIMPAPTQYAIATRISTHREAVSRELSVLESRGLLKVSRRKIVVLDLRRLRAMLNLLDDDEL